MTRYSVYVKEPFDSELRKTAKLRGLKPAQLVKERAESPVDPVLLPRIENQILGLFTILEVLAGELGYTSGAMRALVSNQDASKRQGLSLEEALRKAVEKVRESVEVKQQGDLQ